MKDGVAVGNVDHLLVAEELCHKVARVKVVANGHAKTEDEAVGVAAQHLKGRSVSLFARAAYSGIVTYRFNMALDQGVKASLKVWTVFLRIATPADGMSLVVLIDTPSGEDGAMDIGLKAGICQVQGANGIRSYRLGLVVLAPVDVGPPSASGSVQNVGWLGE